MYERSTTASRREAREAATKYLHVACKARMVTNPKHTADNPLPPHQQLIPYVERPGSTYNVGRNAAKRAARARKSA